MRTYVFVLSTILFGALAVPAQTKKPLSETEAIRLAEAFVINNGYTNLPPVKDLSKLAYESLDFTNPNEALNARRNTLERKAYGVKAGNVGRSGWTIVFRYNVSNKQSRKLIPNYEQHIKEIGRAVTMSIDGSEIRMQHQDIYLKGLKLIK
jgi:hypothetical protein